MHHHPTLQVNSQKSLVLNHLVFSNKPLPLKEKNATIPLFYMYILYIFLINMQMWANQIKLIPAPMLLPPSDSL